MTKEKLKTWFLKIFNSCYCVKHEDCPHSIFMIYDEAFIRQNKLCRVTGEVVEYPKEVKGKCLFEIDYEKEYLYMSNVEIWSVFVTYSINYEEITELIRNWIKDSTFLSNIEKDKLYIISSLSQNTLLLEGVLIIL